MGGERVLVTGGSGFVGAHCVARLLTDGHHVTTTVRSPRREPAVRAMVETGGAAAGERLSVVAADLGSDDGWAEAVAGCDFVLHVASPFPPGRPEHEDDLIVPAREGTLRVLRAARDAGVRRVVLTSSFAAIGYGPPPPGRPFRETDWTDPDGDVSAYVKSKTLAERAAWDFMAREGGALELSVVNPVGIFGPVLGPDYAASVNLVKLLMDRAMPGVPRLSFAVVDVRDVADLQVRAMTDPAAAGERFLAAAGGPVGLRDIALMLRARLGPAGRRVPTRRLPDAVVRLAARFSPAAAAIAPDLGRVRPLSNDKARSVLGWQPRSTEDAVVASAESLVRFGLVKSS